MAKQEEKVSVPEDSDFSNRARLLPKGDSKTVLKRRGFEVVPFPVIRQSKSSEMFVPPRIPSGTGKGTTSSRADCAVKLVRL
jgi:hypothetical protein